MRGKEAGNRATERQTEQSGQKVGEKESKERQGNGGKKRQDKMLKRKPVRRPRR